MMAIYKKGSRRLTTCVKNGRCIYTGKSVEDFLSEGYVKISLDEAITLIEKENDKLLKPFKEITEEAYHEALECLPPQNWRSADGVSIFQMSEYYISNITSHYAVFDGRYFTAYRRENTPYEEIAKEIKEIVNG